MLIRSPAATADARPRPRSRREHGGDRGVHDPGGGRTRAGRVACATVSFALVADQHPMGRSGCRPDGGEVGDTTWSRPRRCSTRSATTARTVRRRPVRSSAGYAATFPSLRTSATPRPPRRCARPPSTGARAGRRRVSSTAPRASRRSIRQTRRRPRIRRAPRRTRSGARSTQRIKDRAAVRSFAASPSCSTHEADYYADGIDMTFQYKILLRPGRCVVQHASKTLLAYVIGLQLAARPAGALGGVFLGKIHEPCPARLDPRARRPRRRRGVPARRAATIRAAARGGDAAVRAARDAVRGTDGE